jgi:hypothetical protein
MAKEEMALFGIALLFESSERAGARDTATIPVAPRSSIFRRLLATGEIKLLVVKLVCDALTVDHGSGQGI